jgi:beta-alanine degradation protein BauB
MRDLRVAMINVFLLLVVATTSFAESNKTQRIPEFSNEQVNVWKTIIYPNSNQTLKMHRHERNRVVVALDAGTLKITNNNGEVHYLKLEKRHAYFLPKNVPGELHSDENIGRAPIAVVVIELKDHKS